MIRRFELNSDSSAKFWQITLSDLTLTTRYGRMGTNGQQTAKTFAATSQASRELERLVKEKTAKGYVEVSGAMQAPQTVYLEHPQTRQFFEIAEADNHLRVRRGRVGSPCLEYHAPFVTPGEARTQLERLVSEWQTKGFVVTPPSELVLAGSVAHSLFTDEIEDHPMYSKFFDLGWASELRGQRKRLFHFREGLRVQGNFDLEEIADMRLEAGVIIEGDAVVDGVFSQLTYTYPGSTLVSGSVRAQSLAHADSSLRILGDVRVDNIIYGEYNDGMLVIDGTACGVAWIKADHMMFAAHYQIQTFDEDYGLLTPKVLNLDGGLDSDAIREYIYANKNPLRKGAVPSALTPEPLSASAPDSALALEVRALLVSEDVEGSTQLLETWTTRDDESRGFVEERLVAPSSTRDERERLRALLDACQAPLTAETAWTPPASGQVTDPLQAHPRVARILRLMTDPTDPDDAMNWTFILDALESPFTTGVIESHAWLLLVTAVQRAYLNTERYKDVVERLLDLGADPSVEFTDMTTSVVRHAERLGQHAIIELFYTRFPALRPAPEDTVHGPEILGKLIQLEDSEADLDAPEIDAAWLEAIYQLKVVSEKVKRIPRALGRLPNLRSLHLAMLEIKPARRTLPDSLGELVQLEDLELVRSGFERIPDLSELTNLRQLSLRGNKLTALPALPSGLERLIYDENPISQTPDLSPLTKLKILSLDNVRLMPTGLGELRDLREFSASACKLEELPSELLNLPTLQKLVLSKNKLSSLPDLSGLSALRVLDLANNELHALPTGLLALDNLESLVLEGNRSLEDLVERDAAQRAICEQLQSRGVQFTVESHGRAAPAPRRIDSITRQMLNEIKRLNQQASDHQTSDPSAALGLFERVIETSSAHLARLPEDFAHDHLHALQGRLWCINELAQGDATMIERAIKLAKEVLEFTTSDTHFHYSAEGELVRSAETLAHNALAWYGLQNATDLPEALEHINAATESLDYASQPEVFATVFENKVKILFASGRDDDAHGITYQVHRAFPELEVFQRLVQTQAFQRWDSEH